MTHVKVEQGELKGTTCKGIHGKYIAFKGIPYAKPPVGKLRFKAPAPPEHWSGVRNASEHGPICPQYNVRLNRLEEGNEDCLYLNVYTKETSPRTPSPVMVWIHGGGFYTGSGDSDFYGPDFILEHDVVLVTFNYRLEVLGFLCLDNDAVPGNAGLKDQVAALTWVQKNISVFGGDPNNVTIFGCSAGAASVAHHILSKLSRGLFHKAICQSGTCLNDWSYSNYGVQRAFQLGKLLGNNTDNVTELLEFLQNVPVSSLVNITLKADIGEFRDLTDAMLFVPVIEKITSNGENFITESPLRLLEKGDYAQVPLIVGYTSGDGIEAARRFIPNPDSRNQFIELNIPREIKSRGSYEMIQDLSRIVVRFYFEEDFISSNKLEELVNLDTDLIFAYGARRFAKYLARNCPVYFYKFMADTERNYTKKQYEMSHAKGVCHSDDLFYLFHVTCLDVPFSKESETYSIIRNVVDLWTSFANTGNPTKTANYNWKTFTVCEENYLEIDKIMKCKCNPDKERMLFWDSIFSNIYPGILQKEKEVLGAAPTRIMENGPIQKEPKDI